METCDIDRADSCFIDDFGQLLLPNLFLRSTTFSLHHLLALIRL
jgi:hypothetical protein